MAGDLIPVRGQDAGFVTKVEERLNELFAGGFEISKVDAVVRNKK